MEKTVDARFSQEAREFGDQSNGSSLVNFNKFLGFSLEGFEMNF